MDNEKLLKGFWDYVEKEVNSRREEDYFVDKRQMDKLVAAYGFFAGLAAVNDGSVELSAEPKWIHGGVTAYFRVFYISGDDMQKFSKLASTFSALSIDSTSDGSVCISFTIPKVFVHK